MVFTSIVDIYDDEYLINLEQLCYIKRSDSDEGDEEYELWFTHERGLGLNSIDINSENAQKLFFLIKQYAKHLEGAETKL